MLPLVTLDAQVCLAVSSNFFVIKGESLHQAVVMKYIIFRYNGLVHSCTTWHTKAKARWSFY